MYTDITLDLVTAYYMGFPNYVQQSPGQGHKCVSPEKENYVTYILRKCHMH